MALKDASKELRGCKQICKPFLMRTPAGYAPLIGGAQDLNAEKTVYKLPEQSELRAQQVGREFLMFGCESLRMCLSLLMFGEEDIDVFFNTRSRNAILVSLCRICSGAFVLNWVLSQRVASCGLMRSGSGRLMYSFFWQEWNCTFSYCTPYASRREISTMRCFLV